MNILILGAGGEERSWASWVSSRPEHELAGPAQEPPGVELTAVRATAELDEALALPGLELVIVGGPPGFRSEALRRAAAEGLAIICLHPPGEDSEAYYQVALSRLETGAVVVPDLPLRLHPGVARLRQALSSDELGAFRVLRVESPHAGGDGFGDLARAGFSRVVDVVRALLGEIEAVTASGDPPGVKPDVELVVQIRAAAGRRAEVRVWAGGDRPLRLVLQGTRGSITLECQHNLEAPAHLVRQAGSGAAEEVLNLEPWDRHAAVVAVLRQTLEKRASAADADAGADAGAGPSLIDGTRAMEVSEAVVRSLRRGRTIDLHYESISEESTFKSIMTSTGCMILLAVLLILPVALAGPPLGFPWTIYLAYLIPPVLVVFAVLQVLRLGIRNPPGDSEQTR